MDIKFRIEKKIIKAQSEELQSNQITINSSPYNYTVFFIDKVTLGEVIRKIKVINGKKNFIYVDKNVDKIYKHSYWKNIDTINLIANENTKTVQSALTLVNELSNRNFTKSEVLLTIGGGITQDVSAFSRAVFKRGINWVYVPTTLLSMSDSCIGAKSAINYGTTKNLLGLFSAPKEVYINIDLLKSLNNRDILSGYGEILKLCIIGGKYTFEQFFQISEKQNGNLYEHIEILIKYALLVKKSVIIRDEFEENIRKALNYGHTVGHAIEPLVNYKIPHGIAILIGMYLENYISTAYGFLSLSECNKLNSVIIRYIDSKSLSHLTEITLDKLLGNMKKDKKNHSNMICFSVPVKIGYFKMIQIKNNKTLLNTIDKGFQNLHNSYIII
jgi:3-dehydroquinate synthase